MFIGHIGYGVAVGAVEVTVFQRVDGVGVRQRRRFDHRPGATRVDHPILCAGLEGFVVVVVTGNTV